MKNVHTRVLSVPPERVRPWIESCWSATPLDPFPRDLIRTWRKNPPDVAPLALIPHVTKLGHGAFAFSFESWDGAQFRVRVLSKTFVGWHGFDLRATSTGSELTHTIELDLKGFARLVWPLVIAPIHDFCVEAIFDRIEEGVATGAISEHTKRPLPWLASAGLRAARTMTRRGVKRAEAAA